nr:vitamin K epoxide reductase family protein [Desulfobacula sp.]
MIISLAIAGLLVSTYLSISHFKNYTDIGYKSFCAVSKSINCDTVSQSPYSIFLGVPVPIWGVLGYILIIIILFFSLNVKEKKMGALSTLLLIGVLYSAIGLFLGIISAAKIHSYCIMCIVIYGINFMLFYMFWLIRRRFEKDSFINLLKKDFLFWKKCKKMVITLGTISIAAFLSLMFFFPHYWELSPPLNAKDIKTGYTEGGYPWIGAENPELTITEFADYQCFQCRKLHFFLRTLIATYPDKLRLIHRHFPMDHKFNPIVKEPLSPGSGILALIAIYASEKNRFWEINDLLYTYDMSRGAIYLEEIAESVNFEPDKMAAEINSPRITQKLYRDIIAGLKNNIYGTPSYLINGQMYTGYIPKYVLDSLRK